MLQAWDRDLPHTRNQCGVHRNFSRTRSTGNAAHCAKVRLPTSPAASSSLHCFSSWLALHAQETRLHLIPSFVLQCYCFICDAVASQCKEWGTGEAAITLLHRACSSRRCVSQTCWVPRPAPQG